MSNQKINIVSNIVLPIVVVGTTIGMFFLLKPQETTSLFWINLFYTVFLEVVFFGYINVLHLKTKDLSSPFYAVFGAYCFYYIILGLVCMVGYTFMVKFIYAPETNKAYIAALMNITLLWVIVSVITAQTDSNYKQTVVELKERGQSLNFFTQKIALLASRYEKLCAEKGLKYETQSSNRVELDRLKGKISFLTPNVFNNDTAVAQITALFGKCEDLIDEMEEASAEKAPTVQKKMQRFVDNAVSELDMVKNLART